MESPLGIASTCVAQLSVNGAPVAAFCHCEYVRARAVKYTISIVAKCLSGPMFTNDSCPQKGNAGNRLMQVTVGSIML